MTIKLHTPISDEEIRNLKVGDTVLVSGFVVTGRDAAHKWLEDTFIHPQGKTSAEDQGIFDELKKLLNGGLIYHCGPVVAGLDTKQYKFVAAGPTTSVREEPYQADVMKLFNLKGVIGKGGMGKKTLEGCHNLPAAYFHAIGGAASLIAESVKEVIGVYKYEFGVPEAMWVIRVEDLPVVVTMDAHQNSLHATVREKSNRVLSSLID